MKIRTYYCGERPSEFQRSDFYSVIRLDIKEESTEDESATYSALEFTINEPISQNAFIKDVLDEVYGIDYENKLINEYNSAILGLYSDEEKEVKIKSYNDFLSNRISLKSDIERICKENGIF